MDEISLTGGSWKSTYHHFHTFHGGAYFTFAIRGIFQELQLPPPLCTDSFIIPPAEVPSYPKHLRSPSPRDCYIHFFN